LSQLGSYAWCGLGIMVLTVTAAVLSFRTVDPQAE